MSLPHWMSPMRRVRACGFAFVAAVAILASGLAAAQSAPSPNQPSSSGLHSAAYSSSDDPNLSQLAESVAPGGLAALPAAPSPGAGASAAGQDTHSGWKQSLFSNYALELGGGLSAPTSKTYITWGGGFTLGGGYNFNKRFAVLAEYQFLDNKLPGAIIAETGATGGHAHIWSLTLDPVVSLFPKSANDFYITGGGGFYRKVTSFTDVEPTEYCSFYYCGIGYSPQVVGHFSSNQGGFNIGGGYQRRLGGMYLDSKTKLFAEVRLVDVLTPTVLTQPSGLGTTSIGAGTKLIPISVGIRW